MMKFVPASVAASRMFKSLYAFKDSNLQQPEDEATQRFFEHIEEFAFFPALEGFTIELYGLTVGQLIAEKRYKDIVKLVLEKEGLHYGIRREGLIHFHRKCAEKRARFLEQMVGGVM